MPELHFTALFCQLTMLTFCVFTHIFALRHVVGYNSKPAEANLNWYAPHFVSVGGNTIDINSIQLDDGGAMSVGWGDSMQVVGPLGNAKEMYFYYDKSMMGTSQNYWGDTDLNPVAVSFDKGDGIAIDNSNELTFDIQNAGEIIKGEVRFAAAANLNWSGNPFAAPINLNAVQLDDDGAMTVGWGDSMQIVGPLGNAKEMYFYYDKSMMEGATQNYWGDTDLNPVNVTLQPGDGFAIDNSNELVFDIVITAPYSL